VTFYITALEILILTYLLTYTITINVHLIATNARTTFIAEIAAKYGAPVYLQKHK